MTDKMYYQTAASEVAGGQFDQALWVKVSAEMPGADSVARQAKYIQLRARELAHETTKSHARTWFARVRKGAIVIAVLWAALLLLGSLSEWLAVHH